MDDKGDYVFRKDFAPTFFPGDHSRVERTVNLQPLDDFNIGYILHQNKGSTNFSITSTPQTCNLELVSKRYDGVKIVDN